jgi:cell division septal protein FtsQ
MARSDISGTAKARRIVENAQARTPEQEREDAAERILSQRSKPASPVRRVKKKRSAPQAFAMAVFKMVILAGVVVGGIAIIIWMRNFAAENGIIWIGDE